MKELSWDEYFDGFWDWSLSTQKNYANRLLNFGSSDEVLEIINEFTLYDPGYASRFAEKALRAGVRFTSEQVLEMTILVDRTVLGHAAETAGDAFDPDQLEELRGLIDDGVFARIAAIHRLPEDEPEGEWGEPISREKGRWFPVSFGDSDAEPTFRRPSRRKKHHGRCDGDCANCPAHYGYRYGRWYYGHDHVHGCEFGGNKGSGGRD